MLVALDFPGSSLCCFAAGGIIDLLDRMLVVLALVGVFGVFRRSALGAELRDRIFALVRVDKPVAAFWATFYWLTWPENDITRQVRRGD